MFCFQDLSLAGALVVLVSAFFFVCMICRVSLFDNRLKEMEAEFKTKYNMNSLKTEARQEFEKFKSEKERLVVEDVEEHHKKKKHKRKHRNRVEPVTEMPPADGKRQGDDHSDEDDRIVNIKNSVVYITSNPPSPTHGK